MTISLRSLYCTLVLFFTFLCLQGSIAQLDGADAPLQSICAYESELKVDQLLLLIQKRLAIMHEVARTKWNQNLPIEDLARERQILEDLSEKAGSMGLDKQWVTRFFQAQMDAAKEIQRRDFAQWREKGIILFSRVYSLKDDLRGYIDRITVEMTVLLSGIPPEDYHYVLNCPLSSRPADEVENAIWRLAISPFAE